MTKQHASYAKLAQLLGVVSLLLGAAAAQAQTRYVVDTVVITLRTGPSTQNTITRNLTSGDRVEVLEELPDEGYSRVRLPDGEEGWVLSRYLQTDLTAAQRLAQTSNELTAAEQRVIELESRLAELEAELDSLRTRSDAAESSSTQLEAELAQIRDASANAIATRNQNESLRLRVSELTAAADVAEVEIRELRSRNRQSWFIVGAAVLFGGVVIGLVAPSLRRQRRSSW